MATPTWGVLFSVADGQDAALAWESLVRGGLDQAKLDRIEKALLDYRGQDRP
jgi:hypothetical protein